MGSSCVGVGLVSISSLFPVMRLLLYVACSFLFVVTVLLLLSYSLQQQGVLRMSFGMLDMTAVTAVTRGFTAFLCGPLLSHHKPPRRTNLNCRRSLMIVGHDGRNVLSGIQELGWASGPADSHG